MLLDGFLRAPEVFFEGSRRTREQQVGMAVAVVADFVAGIGDGARDLRQAVDIGAALEEGGGGVVAGQDLEDFKRGFAGAVVEGERDGALIAGAAPDAGAKD
jgi:hypothetical protein